MHFSATYLTYETVSLHDRHLQVASARSIDADRRQRQRLVLFQPFTVFTVFFDWETNPSLLYGVTQNSKSQISNTPRVGIRVVFQSYKLTAVVNRWGR